MKTRELALPEPSAVTLWRAKDLAVQAHAIREQCREQKNDVAADELRRRLAAFRSYVSDRKAAELLQGEERLTEVLIGELLGPAENRGPATVSGGDGLEVSRQLRHEFRRLAAHAAIVKELVDEGTVARATILREIDRRERVASAPEEQDGTGPVIVADIAEAVIVAESVDVIITDPPYGADHLDVYDTLGERALEWLRPGGSLVAMVGQYHLPAVIESLARSLRYQWTLAYLTPGGQSPQIWPRHVNTFWKPLLWFVSGDYDGDWIGDVIHSDVNDNDKRFHGWGQSESGMARIVERFTKEGDLVCDPFAGGGTTGVVCKALGRRFIGVEIDSEMAAVATSRIGEV